MMTDSTSFHQYPAISMQDVKNFNLLEENFLRTNSKIYKSNNRSQIEEDYGWEYSGEGSILNLFFLGTGTRPEFYPEEGKFNIYEGGDLLCNLAMSARLLNQRTLIVRGVGTEENRPSSLFEKPGGIILGVGIDKRIDIAIDFLLKYQNNITEINLIGHSRGAITCFALSSMLSGKVENLKCKQIFKEIKKKVLVYDPVYGYLKASTKGNYCELEVEEFCGIYAESEYRSIFTPLLPKFYEKLTKFQFHVQIGLHGSMKGNLGDHSNLQYAFCKEEEFLKRASRSVVDNTFLISSLFLWPENLPSFLPITFYDIGDQVTLNGSSVIGYPQTRNLIVEIFNNKWKDRSGGSISDLQQLFLSLENKDRKLLYFSLECDIHDNYLRKDPQENTKESGLLNEWIVKMKKNSSRNIEIVQANGKTSSSILPLQQLLPIYSNEYKSHVPIGGYTKIIDHFYFDIEKFIFNVPLIIRSKISYLNKLCFTLFNMRKFSAAPIPVITRNIYAEDSLKVKIYKKFNSIDKKYLSKLDKQLSENIKIILNNKMKFQYNIVDDPNIKKRILFLSEIPKCLNLIFEWANEAKHQSTKSFEELQLFSRFVQEKCTINNYSNHKNIFQVWEWIMDLCILAGQKEEFPISHLEEISNRITLLTFNHRSWSFGKAPNSETLLKVTIKKIIDNCVKSIKIIT